MRRHAIKISHNCLRCAISWIIAAHRPLHSIRIWKKSFNKSFIGHYRHRRQGAVYVLMIPIKGRMPNKINGQDVSLNTLRNNGSKREGHRQVHSAIWMSQVMASMWSNMSQFDKSALRLLIICTMEFSSYQLKGKSKWYKNTQDFKTLVTSRFPSLCSRPEMEP